MELVLGVAKEVIKAMQALNIPIQDISWYTLSGDISDMGFSDAFESFSNSLSSFSDAFSSSVASSTSSDSSGGGGGGDGGGGAD